MSEQPQKPKRVRKSVKRRGWNSILYSFRLPTEESEFAAAELFEAWVKNHEEEHNLDRATAVRVTVLGLIDEHLGDSVPSRKRGGMEVLATQLNRLEKKLDTRLSEVIDLLLKNPRAAAAIADASERGESIDDDLIANLLEDFDRD